MQKPRITRDQIEEKLITGEYVRSLRDNINRQAWGGAGVVVQSIACRDAPELNVPGTKVLRTIHAQAVGRLFRDISSWITKFDEYNYFSKAQFWDQLTTEGLDALKADPDVSAERLLSMLWARALSESAKLTTKGNHE